MKITASGGYSAVRKQITKLQSASFDREITCVPGPKSPTYNENHSTCKLLRGKKALLKTTGCHTSWYEKQFSDLKECKSKTIDNSAPNSWQLRNVTSSDKMKPLCIISVSYTHLTLPTSDGV